MPYRAPEAEAKALAHARRAIAVSRRFLVRGPWVHPLLPGSPQVRIGWAERGRLTLAWLLACVLAPWLLLILDTSLSSKNHLLALTSMRTWGAFAYAAAGAGLRCGVLALALHCAQTLAHRMWPTGFTRRPWLFPLLALGASLPVLVSHTIDLSASEAIARHPSVAVLRPGVTILGLASFALSWALHLATLNHVFVHRGGVGRAIPSSALWRVRLTLLFFIGLAITLVDGLARAHTGYAELWFDLASFNAATLLCSVLVGKAEHDTSVQGLGRQPRDIVLGCTAVFALGLALTHGQAQPAGRHRGKAPAALDDHALSSVAARRLLSDRVQREFSIDLLQLNDKVCAKQRRPARPSRLSISRAHRRHILAISVEGLRRDVLDHHLEGVPIMPNLAKFRKVAADFRRASSPAPSTLFALTAAWTGSYASEIAYAPAPIPTVFEHAKKRFDEHAMLMPEHRRFKWPGFVKTLVQKSRIEYKRTPRGQVDSVFAWLQFNKHFKRRLFGHVHFDGPTQPYMTQEGFDYGEGAEARYLSELSRIDAYIGEILTALESGNWFDDTMVIIFGTHGEAVGERGYFGHAGEIRDHVSGVPLLVRAPGMRPAAIDRPVSLIDLATTVSHFVDLDPAPHFMGESLFEVARRARSQSARQRSMPVIVESFAFPTYRLGRDLDEPPSSALQLAWRIEDRETQGLYSFAPEVLLADGDDQLLIDRQSGEFRFFRHTQAGGALARPVDTLLPVRQDFLRAKVHRWYADSSARVLCRYDRWQVLAAKSPDEHGVDLRPPVPKPTKKSAPEVKPEAEPKPEKKAKTALERKREAQRERRRARQRRRAKKRARARKNATRRRSPKKAAPKPSGRKTPRPTPGKAMPRPPQ